MNRGLDTFIANSTYLSLDKYLRGQYKVTDLPPGGLEEATELIRRVNRCLNIVDGLLALDTPARKLEASKVFVTSGYRSKEHNARIGGSSRSAHVECKAVDVADVGQIISQFLYKDWLRWKEDSVLAICDLYLEHPSATASWCHLTTRPVSVRVFNP